MWRVWLTIAFVCANAFGLGKVDSLAKQCVASLSSNARQLLGYADQTVLLNEQVIGKRKASIRYPKIASVHQIHLPKRNPKKVRVSSQLSPGLSDPLLELARRLGIAIDFKQLSDFCPKRPCQEDHSSIGASLLLAGFDTMDPDLRALTAYIGAAYEDDFQLTRKNNFARPKWKISTNNERINSAFSYSENLWSNLFFETPSFAIGSLIPAPYPLLVASASGRFSKEAYYWDSAFGVAGLLASGRIELAAMVIENLLSMIRRFGFIPNGLRDYFLTRSQPPFIASMVKAVYAKSSNRKKTEWLRRRAFPLLKKDYEFWMTQRFNEAFGLNHWGDAMEISRPERSQFDLESLLGLTRLDERAEAESGHDFWDAYGREAAHIASVFLNSKLYEYELILAEFADQLESSSQARYFRAQAEQRKLNMKILWNESKGHWEDYHMGSPFKRPGQMGVLTAHTLSPLVVGLATPDQAKRAWQNAKALFRRGGIVASNLVSGKPWDEYVWAPWVSMAVDAGYRYGFVKEANSLAWKWLRHVANAHYKFGTMYERMDPNFAGPPRLEGNHYHTQEDFMWTAATFTALLDKMGVPFEKIQ